MTTHANNFPIISAILTTSTKAQSVSLRQKSAKLLIGDASDGNPTADTGPEANLSSYRNSIEQRLWDLVQTTLKPDTRTKNANARLRRQQDEPSGEVFEFMPFELDGLDEFGDEIPFDVYENIGSDDIDFNSHPDEYWPLDEYQGFPTYHDDDDPNMIVEYHQRWHEDEYMDYVDEHLPPEATDFIKEEPGYLPDSGFHGFSSDLPPLGLEELQSTSATQQYTDEFSQPVMDDDNMYASDYDYDDEMVYYVMDDELPYNPEAAIGDETWEDRGDDVYYEGFGEGSIDEDCYLDEEQVKLEDIEMYQQY